MLYYTLPRPDSWDDMHNFTCTVGPQLSTQADRRPGACRQALVTVIQADMMGTSGTRLTRDHQPFTPPSSEQRPRGVMAAHGGQKNGMQCPEACSSAPNAGSACQRVIFHRHPSLSPRHCGGVVNAIDSNPNGSINFLRERMRSFMLGTSLGSSRRSIKSTDEGIGVRWRSVRGRGWNREYAWVEAEAARGRTYGGAKGWRVSPWLDLGRLAPCGTFGT